METFSIYMKVEKVFNCKVKGNQVGSKYYKK